MALYKKEVSESLDFEEKSLEIKKTDSEGESILKIILSSIWEGISKVTTTWKSTVKWKTK